MGLSQYLQAGGGEQGNPTSSNLWVRTQLSETNHVSGITQGPVEIASDLLYFSAPRLPRQELCVDPFLKAKTCCKKNVSGDLCEEPSGQEKVPFPVSVFR